MLHQNMLKRKLDAGSICYGTHISLGSSNISEIFGHIGFDYLWIDTEHTTISLEQVQLHAIACRSTMTSVLVRVPWNDPVKIKHVLEIGVDGIVIPMVNTYEEAQRAVSACLYPPKGNRGFGPQRAIDYGLAPINSYLQHAQNEILKIIQVEHITAVKNLKEILSIPEIDVIMLGPCDLAASMGKIGDWYNKEVQDVIAEICKAVISSGKKLGVSFGPCSDLELQKWQKYGVNMMSISGDTAFLIEGASNIYKRMTNSQKRVGN